MGSDVTPFKGRLASVGLPSRVLKRFGKAGHVAEIRERTVTSFSAFEFIVFVDGSLLESQMFHGTRLKEYGPALTARAKQFSDNGWIEQCLDSTDLRTQEATSGDEPAED